METNPKIVERAIIMTTDPGDLVLDPTCGSGTTPYVSEKHGRRWIAVDTSRALTLSRERILTSSFSLLCSRRSCARSRCRHQISDHATDHGKFSGLW